MVRYIRAEESSRLVRRRPKGEGGTDRVKVTPIRLTPMRVKLRLKIAWQGFVPEGLSESSPVRSAGKL
jgi:hypothetical protein